MPKNRKLKATQMQQRRQHGVRMRRNHLQRRRSTWWYQNTEFTNELELEP